MEPREALPAALERVKRCIRGGAAEDDDDIEFGNVVVSLKDPYTCWWAAAKRACLSHWFLPSSAQLQWARGSRVMSGSSGRLTPM